jgi:hypothetical protein
MNDCIDRKNGRACVGGKIVHPRIITWYFVYWQLNWVQSTESPNRTEHHSVLCVIWHMLNVFKEGTRPSTYFKNNTHILWRVQRDYGCIHNSTTVSYKIYER